MICQITNIYEAGLEPANLTNDRRTREPMQWQNSGLAAHSAAQMKGKKSTDGARRITVVFGNELEQLAYMDIVTDYRI